MRPSQHSKRSRGRSRHHSSGGGGSNPINRVYDSNGPDVKVRGTAQTVAEKYLQLGRDAHSSGDTVMAESYYQHAEHYLRILAAAQAYSQQMQQPYRRPDDVYEDDEGDDMGTGGDAGPERPAAGAGQAADQPTAMVESDRPPPQNRDARPRPDSRDRYRPRYGRPGEQPRLDEQPQPREAAPESGGEANWVEGHEPSFLRRPMGHGASRPRYERRPRKEQPQTVERGSEAPATTVPVAVSTEDPAGE